MKNFKRKTTGFKFLFVLSGMCAFGVNAQIVHLGDVVIDGSACVGFDCVNPTAFGFDTLRLQENNLRIKFQDTSTAASFPSNDWQLTANDSANGGANKFSIDDVTGGRTPFTVEANAPSHSLYVDDGGRVGLGTSIPVVDLHVVSGNTPTLRLAQDGSSGFTPQTWDVAGNEAGFFVRDVTNGSSLPFRIRPGADSSALVIAADSNIGIGTLSPDSHLDIEAATPEFRLTGLTSGEQWEMRVNGSGTYNFQPIGTGNNLFSMSNTATARIAIGFNAAGAATADQVTVHGNLVGTGTITPDFVFEPSYKLESIEDHAAFMWDNKHLPEVTKATPDGKGTHSVNLTKRAQGLLHELEIAHIYIEQLNKQVQKLQSRMDEM